MGMFFLRAEALGAEQPIGADASVRARDKGDGMECPGNGRRGTRWHRGDVKKGGAMVAAVLFVLRCAIESPKFHRSFGSYWQFLHIRNDGRNGLVATESRQILERWCRARKKEKTTQQIYNCPHRSKKSPKGQQTPNPGLRLV